MNTSSSVATALASLLVVTGFMLGLFLLLRAVVLWYWKVNRIVELLESIDARLLALGGAAPRSGPAEPGPGRTYASMDRR